MVSGYCILGLHRSRGLFSGEDKTEDPGTRAVRQSPEDLQHTRTVHTHRMLRAWMLQLPPSSPHGSRHAGGHSLTFQVKSEIWFSEECYYPKRTHLKILTLGAPQLMAHSSHSLVKFKVHRSHTHAQPSPHV